MEALQWPFFISVQLLLNGEKKNALLYSEKFYSRYDVITALYKRLNMITGSGAEAKAS